MARLPRIVIPNHPHHVIQEGVRAMAIFRHDGDRKRYLQFMAEECERFQLEILAWCLMRSYVHLVGVPAAEQALARAVGNAHRRYTRMRNFDEGVRGYLFQGRFSSCAMDERHLIASARYALLDPVVSRLAKRAWEYPWSSAAMHVGVPATRSLPGVDQWGSDRSHAEWREMLTEPLDDRVITKIRQETMRGRPLGSEAFVNSIELAIGRSLRHVRRDPHRPQ